MADLHHRPRQSDLQAVVEGFQVGGESVDLTKHLQGLELERTSHASSKGTLTLYDEEWDALEDLFMERGLHAPVTFRYGWLGNLSPIQHLSLGSYSPAFDHHGVTLTIDLVDSGSAVNLKNRSSSWPPTTRISDIVLEIAHRNNWGTVVEETKQYPEPITQNNIPDTQFLIRTLHEMAVNNQAGEAGYVCYLEAAIGAQKKDTLHFHTPGFGQATKGEVARVFNFARDFDGEMLSFEPEDLQLMGASLGSRINKAEQMDTRKGAVSKIDTRDEGGLANADGSAQGDGAATKLNGPGKQSSIHDEEVPHRYTSRAFRTPQEQENYVKHRQMYFANLQFQAAATILGDHSLYPMQIIEINVIKSSGELHKRWSGRYTVRKVVHTIEGGSFMTNLDLMRRTDGVGTVTASGKEIKLSKPRPADVAPVHGSGFKREIEAAKG